MDYAIRRVAAHEWKRLRDLRLAALRDTPIGFGMWHADALNLPDEYWQEKARRDATDLNSALYIATVGDGDEWIGMAGVFIADQNSLYWVPGRQTAVVFSVFVEPAHRGREHGVSGLLFDAAIAWSAEKHPAADLTLGVHDRNARAHAFYRRYGFVDSGRAIPYNLDETASILLMDYRPADR